MKISKMASGIQQSLTRQLFEKARQYDNVIDFTLGDPDYPTPGIIRKAGCRAIEEGKTKYSANAGIAELRNAISERILEDTGIRYDPDGEIIVTVGAMQALYLSLCCMLDPGDEVIIPAPYWVNYCHMVQMCGCHPILVDTNEETGFVVDVGDIEKAVTGRTKAVIINSPNNPTGMVYDRTSLEKICGLAKKYGFAIVWDECYKHIVYGDGFVSILEIAGSKDISVVINSCSKEFSMTGWRLGYAAAPRELVANMAKLQENMVACAPLPSQYAAIEAFRGGIPETEEMTKGFERRRNMLVSGINGIDGLSCRTPGGTFYAFVNISQIGLGSTDFAYRLLEKKQVAVVPGVTYGDKDDGFIRIAYTVDEDKIAEGVKRIRDFVGSLNDRPSEK